MKKSPSGLAPIIAIDRKAAKPLHRQIYDAYRAAIVDGSLSPGQRIPSTRVLASELGVSRFPVLNAYAQLLAESYFTSRVGAGTVVSNSLPKQLPIRLATSSRLAAIRPGPRRISARSAIPSTVSPWLLGWGPFGVGQVAFDQFPLPIWSKMVARHCRTMNAKAFHYGHRSGSRNLREAIAGYLKTARSLHCDADQIMIVSGSQQALEVSAQVLVDPGRSVWVEDPGYRYARDAFALAGSKLVPVPVDREGLDVAEGIRRCRDARVAYVTPSHQFPLGYTMSASRRFQLLSWAQNAGAWVVEDDYDSEYRYESLPIASVQGIDVNRRVIYIGTFSKVLFPSLRLGYVVMPPDLVDGFLSMRRVMDLGQSSLYQEVLAEFIREGHFARHIRRMRTLYSQRRSVLIESIQQEFGSMVEVVGSSAGMHLTLLLPKGSRDLEMAERAAQQNLWIWPLSSCYLGPSKRPGLILGFGSTPVEDIPQAVRRLRGFIKQ